MTGFKQQLEGEGVELAIMTYDFPSRTWGMTGRRKRWRIESRDSILRGLSSLFLRYKSLMFTLGRKKKLFVLGNSPGPEAQDITTYYTLALLLKKSNPWVKSYTWFKLKLVSLSFPFLSLQRKLSTDHTNHSCLP